MTEENCLWVRSIAKSGFPLLKSGFQMCKNRIKTDINAEKSVLGFPFFLFFGRKSSKGFENCSQGQRSGTRTHNYQKRPLFTRAAL